MKRKIPFIKMSGAGNDFIMIDKPRSAMNLKKLAVNICDRTNGIGADGLIVLDKSKRSDYKMRIINADGSEAEMCGNGARCFASYVVKTRGPKKKLLSFETLAGTILGQANGKDTIVRLSNPVKYRACVPITIAKRKINVSTIDTGVPHAIVYVNDLENINVNKIGYAIRQHNKFKPRGTNVNFAEQVKKDLVSVRTYERGVEDETKACGTGSVAVALVTYMKANPKVKAKDKAKMKVRTTGGETLEVTFDLKNEKISNVWLKGSAHFIAKGEYYV